MKQPLMIILMAAAIITVACQPNNLQPQPNNSSLQPTNAECTADSDCGTGGCSGQVCTTAAEAAGLITTCEYKAEYACLKLTSCGCVDGKCAWQQNTEYAACLDKAKSETQLQQPQ